MIPAIFWQKNKKYHSQEVYYEINHPKGLRKAPCIQGKELKTHGKDCECFFLQELDSDLRL